MRDKVSMANDAKALTSNPVYKEAMDKLTAECVRLLQESGFDGSEKAEKYREKLNMMLYIQGQFKRILSSYVTSGQLEAKALEKKSLRNPKGL